MTEQQQQPEQQPVSPQEAQPVVQAGVEAAAADKDAGKAMREERDRRGARITDEEIDKIAEVLAEKNTDKMIEKMRNLGAFDQPPEPVRPPEQAQAPAAPGEPATEPAAEQPPPQPQKKTLAHRFMGV